MVLRPGSHWRRSPWLYLLAAIALAAVLIPVLSGAVGPVGGGSRGSWRVNNGGSATIIPDRKGERLYLNSGERSYPLN